MGANLRFIAFRNEPDVAALKSLGWIEAFRLFGQKDEPRWFLEGPSLETNGITLYESLLVSRPEARDAALAVQPEIDRLIAATPPATWLDDEALSHALMISKALQTPALVGFGDDEGMDGAIVCSDGRLAGGRLQADDKALAIDADGAFSFVPLYAEGEDPEEGRELYKIVAEEAGRFFGLDEPLPVSSDPGEDLSAYRLVASVGEAIDTTPPEKLLERQIWAISTSDVSPMRKIAKYVAIMDPHISAALREEVISLTRRARDPLERFVWACRISDYAPGIEATARQAALLNSYTRDLANYLVALRPSPDYRKAIDFQAHRNQLKTRWSILRLRLSFGSHFGL